jgi:hypothetical protein
LHFIMTSDSITWSSLEPAATFTVVHNFTFCTIYVLFRPPLWSEFLATDPEARFLFPALPDFLRNNESGSGPLRLVSTIEELIGRKCSGSGLENQEYGRRYTLRWSRGYLFPQKWALSSPTSGDRSVCIARSRTQAREFSFLCTVSDCFNKWFYRIYYRTLETALDIKWIEWFYDLHFPFSFYISALYWLNLF